MGRLPPYHELQFEAVRSRGPGGQNVNKTNSASILRWNVPSTTLPEPVRLRLLDKLGPQLTETGDLLIRSDVHRDLEQNKKACLEKLSAAIEKALFVPKKRVKTKPTYSAVRKRLDSKRKASDKKRSRSNKDWD